jgi:hypothetical protein
MERFDRYIDRLNSNWNSRETDKNEINLTVTLNFPIFIENLGTGHIVQRRLLCMRSKITRRIHIMSRLPKNNSEANAKKNREDARYYVLLLHCVIKRKISATLDKLLRLRLPSKRESRLCYSSFLLTSESS